MRLATKDETKFIHNRYEALPWAAGRPGGMFDRPEDILFCDGNDLCKEGYDWLTENEISNNQKYYRNPHVARVNGSYANEISYDGTYWFQIHQANIRITFNRESEDFTILNKQIDLLLPRMLPVVTSIYIKGKLTNIVAKMFSIFEPSLSLHASYKLLESDGTWIISDGKYGNPEIFTSRDEALKACHRRFAWAERKEEEEDTWSLWD